MALKVARVLIIVDQFAKAAFCKHSLGGVECSCLHGTTYREELNAQLKQTNFAQFIEVSWSSLRAEAGSATTRFR